MGLWTKTHAITIFPTFAIFVVIAVLMAKLLKNKSEKVRILPFQIMAGILLGIEVIKQVLAFDADGYDLYALPFHYCSLLLYLYPLHAFGGLFMNKQGKAKKIIDTFTLMCGGSLVIMLLLTPANIYSDGAIKDFFGSYSSFHTVFFHNLASFYLILMVAMKMYEFNTQRDLISTAIFLSAYVIIATVLSYTLKTNYHNLYQCNIDFVWQFVTSLEAKIGVWARVIYISALFVLTTAISYASYYLIKLVVTLVDKFAGQKDQKAE